MGLYEQIERELLDQKSLAALIWLIDRGRELEFSANGVACFISRSGSAQYVSLWVDGSEQSFGSVETLLENASIQQKPLLHLWPLIHIETLF